MELLIIYVCLIIWNFLYGFHRNQVILRFQNQLISDDYYRIKSRRAHFLSLMLTAILIVIISLNKENPDYVTYKWMYDSGMQVEKGWKFLENLAINRGLEYDAFKTAIVTISFILIECGLIKLNINENMVLSIYAFYPFAMDAIQIRNFLATALIVYAYHFLINGSKKGKLIFVIFVILASTIQSLFPIYLLLLFINYENSNPARNKLIGIALVCSLVSILVMKIDPKMVSALGNYLFSSRTDKIDYYVQNNVGWGFFIFGFMQFLFICSIFFCMKNNWDGNEDEIKLLKSIYWSDLLLLCTLPLLTIHIEFYRIYRNMSLLNFIVLPLLLKGRKNNKFLLSIFFFIFALIMYIVMDYFSYSGRFDYVFTTFFK